MRQTNSAKRSRGRSGRKSNNPRSQILDSNGPSVRIRGHALQIYEKYQQLARDATSSGDRIGSENLSQHAEHYYRVALAAGAVVTERPQTDSPPPRQNQNGADGPNNGPQTNGHENGQDGDTESTNVTAVNGNGTDSDDADSDEAIVERPQAAAETESSDVDVEASTSDDAAGGPGEDGEENDSSRPPRRRGRRSRGTCNATSGETDDDGQKVA